MSQTKAEVTEGLLEIIEASHEGGYKLNLKFNDGSERQIDFEPFLSSSLNPHIRKYLDLDLFKQFSLQYGDLQWFDYDLCFPVADLYEEKI